jgi:tetratricopeptide (TPR) repeat protein
MIGCVYFEKNELAFCREVFEIAIEIRERLLPPNHKEVATILSNLGNVESSEGQYEEAFKLFQRARIIREELGDDGELVLGLSFLQIGRVHYLNKNYNEAQIWFEKSEAQCEFLTSFTIF